jgi:hypothetical protein
MMRDGLTKVVEKSFEERNTNSEGYRLREALIVESRRARPASHSVAWSDAPVGLAAPLINQG